jgi:hypothetical protein
MAGCASVCKENVARFNRFGIADELLLLVAFVLGQQGQRGQTERSDNSHTQAIMFQLWGGMGICRLIDHLDKLGLNDALIGGYQPEPMNACSGRNGPVGGVS